MARGQEIDPCMAYAFLHAYLECGNATKAHHKAGFPAANPGARRKAASRLLKRLKSPLEELRKQRGLDWDSMLAELKKTAREAGQVMNEQKPGPHELPAPSPQLGLPGMIVEPNGNT